jgi:hypothetical protein
MSNSKQSTFALTVDIEGEWFQHPGEQGVFDVDRIIYAVKKLENVLELIELKIDKKIPITWFIRCDDSVAANTGEASGILQKLEKFIYRRLERGDEFGLHPHLYRLHEGKWLADIQLNLQIDQIERSTIAWQSFFGLRPKITRMGESVMNNSIASFLDIIGIVIDSSALSSRKRSDNGFNFDWSITPFEPYFPSVEDYRRPPKISESKRGFVEIPFTMLPIKGPNDRASIYRYFNLSYKPNLIEAAINCSEKKQSIISIIHPHELMTSQIQHPIISHNYSAVGDNINYLRKYYSELDYILLSASYQNVC